MMSYELWGKSFIPNLHLLAHSSATSLQVADEPTNVKTHTMDSFYYSLY